MAGFTIRIDDQPSKIVVTFDIWDEAGRIWAMNVVDEMIAQTTEHAARLGGFMVPHDKDADAVLDKLLRGDD